MFYVKIILCLNSFTISTNERAVQVLLFDNYDAYYINSSVFFLVPAAFAKNK